MVSNVVVVCFDVSFEEFVRVDIVIMEGFQYFFGVEVGQGWVVDLKVVKISIIQSFQFFLVCSCDVGKESFIVGVDFGVVVFVRSKMKVEVVWWWYGEFGVILLFFGQSVMEYFLVFEVRVFFIGDFVFIESSYGVLFISFFQGSDWRSGQVDKFLWNRFDFVEIIKFFEEVGEVVFVIKFVRGDGVDVVGLLSSDDFGDFIVLNGMEVFCGDGIGVSFGLGFGERRWVDERVDVVGVEGKFGDWYGGG